MSGLPEPPSAMPLSAQVSWAAGPAAPHLARSPRGEPRRVCGPLLMPRQPLLGHPPRRGGTFLDWPEGPSLAGLEAGWPALPPTVWLHWEGQSGGLRHAAHPPPVSTLRSYWCSSQSKRLGVLQASCPSSLLCTCTPLHTPAHTCKPSLSPDKPRTLPLLPSVSCISLGPGPFTCLPTNSLCPQKCQGALGTSKLFSAFPFWVFSER